MKTEYYTPAQFLTLLVKHPNNLMAQNTANKNLNNALMENIAFLVYTDLNLLIQSCSYGVSLSKN